MQIVIDSNVLFSALIRDSHTRKIILEYDEFFLFPSYIFEELEKHKDELLSKSKMSLEECDSLLDILLGKVVIVLSEMLDRHYDVAYDIVKEIDPNDVLFVACALAYPGSIIWSEDKNLKRQSKVMVLNTKEITRII